MCGILGLTIPDTAKISRNDALYLLRRLFLLSESRGKEASGLAVAQAEKITVYREARSAGAFVKSEKYKAALAGAYPPDGRESARFTALGHARLVTNGIQCIDTNNQPVVSENVALVHNGIVVNAENVWKKIGRPRKTDVDSEVIAAGLAGNLDRADVIGAARAVFAEIRGETNIAAVFSDRAALLLATNSGSLHVAVTDAALCFASEKETLDTITADPRCAFMASARIFQVKAHTGLAVNLENLEHTPFSLREMDGAPFVSPMLAAQRKMESRWQREEEARAALRRCARCLLPESMPFIEFDAGGVCNYCREYKPALCLGEHALEERLAPCRGDGNSPDCVVAFSGGRDSSYGLHLLKKKYGMTPLAYTYDWGMVTDLGRRNQARMCGDLGVEHLWISADIKRQRAYIRSNVSAWMRRPDLGVIPLFMAGDKLFFRFANETMKTKKMPVMVFCSNKLEKTDFKTGFCGISPQFEANQPFSLSLKRKVSLFAYYGKQFLLNPAYINMSIFNTLACYASYYFQEGNYLFLYDYLPWDEGVVNDILIGTYDWETAPDSKSTWRIGDGTAPFYNYVYYTVAGFTEFDTFRSNQIREGHIDRASALASVLEENMPRWDSLREYTRMINIDFERLVRAVDAMPRLYCRDA
ncbi:MAG: hypothetical protein LBD42_05225 [Desulfovibrio sp.]|jgi:asparagine synthetase B (glutamine-hydrolysing)|nr:hypothetical protein [Desulfovibrio sp.]